MRTIPQLLLLFPALLSQNCKEEKHVKPMSATDVQVNAELLMFVTLEAQCLSKIATNEPLYG